MLINRRTFLASPAALSFGQSPARPNILWLSTEDIGNELPCFGDPHAITPTLDKLANEGVRYSHAYTVAGVCAPSRTGIISAMYPSCLGANHMRSAALLPASVKPFPMYLRDAGYYCANNVKTDYNFANTPDGVWDESSNQAHWNKRRPGQPFFSVFNFTVTHESRLVMRGEEFLKQTPHVRPDQRQAPTRLRTLPPFHPDTPEARRDWANYYETITEMDTLVAQRLKELDDAGLAEDTIVMFWGDHGIGLPRAKRWLYESGTRAPIIVRVPEKWRVRGQGKPGSLDRRLVSFLDLGPTFLNLAGIPVPAYMHGRPFLGPNLPRPRKYIHGARDRMDERYDLIRSVRDERFRYIRNYMPHVPYYDHIRTAEQGPTMKELRRLHAAGALPPAAAQFMAKQKPSEELYDVRNDAHEIRNLANDPAHRKTLERLRAEHERWQRETGDIMFLPEPLLAEEEAKLGSRRAIAQQSGWTTRFALLRALAIAPERGAAALPELRAGLAEADPAARWWALQGLMRLEAAPEDTTRLESLLADDSAVVRIVAALALARRGGVEKAVPVLIAGLQHDEEWTRLAAAHALEALGRDAAPAKAALEEAAKEPPRQRGYRFNYVSRVSQRALSLIG